MDGDHPDRIRRPLLQLRIGERHHHVLSRFDGDCATRFFAIDVDGQIRGEAFEVRWPSGGAGT